MAMVAELLQAEQVNRLSRLLKEADSSITEAIEMLEEPPLALPFKWKRAEKVQHKSGRGFYDYLNNSSSSHVLLLDEIQLGRIKRGKGDFLCSKVKVNRKLHDLMHMNDLATTESEVAKSKRQPVTCQRCLELAQRFQGEATHV